MLKPIESVELVKATITNVYLARFWYRVPTLVQLKYFRSESLGGLYSFSLCTMRKKCG